MIIFTYFEVHEQVTHDYMFESPTLSLHTSITINLKKYQ